MPPGRGKIKALRNGLKLLSCHAQRLQQFISVKGVNVVELAVIYIPRSSCWLPSSLGAYD